jgi:hypothetical protein
MPESGDENGQLHGPGSHDEIESNRGPAVLFQENHEESESNVNHHMHILEDWVVRLHSVLLLHLHEQSLQVLI